jgi:hypothetical protein
VDPTCKKEKKKKDIAFNNTIIAKVKVCIRKIEQHQLNRNWKTVTALCF